MTNTEEIKSRIKEIVTPIVENAGAYLVDINLKGIGKKLTVEILVDTDDGITVKKCEEISRQISSALDLHDDFISGSYRLEVSSPGVGNPFKVKRQYYTNIGRHVRIKYVDAVSGELREVFGRLVFVDEEKIDVEEKNTKSIVTLKYEEIVEAKTEIAW